MSEPNNATDATDATLIARCRQGDADAWVCLVRRYQPMVYAVALRAGLDEHGAADVFQTVFAHLSKNVSRLTQPEPLPAWIVTTAKRQALLARRIGQRTVSMTAADDSLDHRPRAARCLRRVSNRQHPHRHP